MTQLHFYPDNEEQEDLEGAQKRKSGIQRKRSKERLESATGRFSYTQKKESEHCLFVNNAYCGLILSVVYLVDMGNMTN